MYIPYTRQHAFIAVEYSLIKEFGYKKPGQRALSGINGGITCA